MFNLKKTNSFLPATTVLVGLMLVPLSAEQAWAKPKHGAIHGCPPGLAKKNNGCLPPGQAKSYVIGRTLPREVHYEPVPPQIMVRLGAAPRNHIYRMVDGDILLISLLTNKVIEAIAAN
jgi:hypothetical protein